MLKNILGQLKKSKKPRKKSFFRTSSSKKNARPDTQLIVTGTSAVAGAGTVLLLIATGASADFIVLTTALLALCGLLMFDIVSRRRWEGKISGRIDELSHHHDRLVREVARNRNDIATLKEGLARMAMSVGAQGRRMGPSASAEAKLIETIVEQLGALGEKPRAEIETKNDAHILELEMTPPPAKEPPRTDLDAALDPDMTQFNDSIVGELLQHAIRHDGIDTFVQPIVSLPQRKTRMVELFGRVRANAGAWLPAARYMELARQEKLVPAIDNMLLLRCLQMLRDQRDEDPMRATTYVLNISGATLNDRGFMGDLVSFLSEYKRLAARLVFELPQYDLENLDDATQAVLGGLSKLGCRFSMDRIRQRRLDVNFLKSRHIRFIKMDAAWLLREGASQDGFSRIIRLKKQLDAAGIDLIVEKIEKEDTLRELLDYHIDFGQGYLFGKPENAAWQPPSRKAA